MAFMQQVPRLVHIFAVTRGRKPFPRQIGHQLLGRHYLHVFIIAGEPSGDMLGAAVMKAIREKV
jgi:hypothetical protein